MSFCYSDPLFNDKFICWEHYHDHLLAPNVLFLGLWCQDIVHFEMAALLSYEKIVILVISSIAAELRFS